MCGHSCAWVYAHTHTRTCTLTHTLTHTCTHTHTHTQMYTQTATSSQLCSQTVHFSLFFCKLCMVSMIVLCFVFVVLVFWWAYTSCSVYRCYVPLWTFGQLCIIVDVLNMLLNKSYIQQCLCLCVYPWRRNVTTSMVGLEKGQIRKNLTQRMVYPRDNYSWDRRKRSVCMCVCECVHAHMHVCVCLMQNMCVCVCLT